MARIASLLLALTLLPHALQPENASMSGMPRHRAPAPPLRLAAQAQGEVEVWIDLSLPALSTAPRDEHEARDRLRANIEAQQDEVMAQLAALGAKEQARILHVRNSLAVRMPASALAQARAIPGVVNVREVKHTTRKD
jgi:hypothetical protein